MAHLVFLFAKAGASAVPAFVVFPEVPVIEGFGFAQVRLFGGAGETPGANVQPRWPRR